MIQTIKETDIIYRNLGFTEDITSCDCCGRVDLKGTYAIENLQTGELLHLGCVCAAHRMNWSKKEFITRYKAEEVQQLRDALSEYRESEAYKAFDSIQKRRWAAIRSGAIAADIDENEANSVSVVLQVLKVNLLKKYPLVKHIY